MPAAVLIVEDEKDIREILRLHFAKEGYKVHAAPTGEAGLKLALKLHPDLLILDISLPKMDGLDLMRRVREFSAAPILMLTAKRTEVDRVLGLKLGADDYITKPFSLRELALRVRSILRRTMAGPRPAADKILRAGAVELDYERRETRVKGRLVPLTPKELLLLKLLIEADGKILSRGQLARGIWGEDESSGFDVRSVDQNLARLRKKLGSERRLIATVSGFGYQLRQDKRLKTRPRA